MQKFSEAVHDDLEMVRKKMGDNAKAADAYLEAFLSNADDWKAKLQSVLQSLSTEAEVDINLLSSLNLRTSLTKFRMWVLP